MTRFCIILGAMKAGTTSLFNYLAQHPDIAPCPEKEPSFFVNHSQGDIQQYLDLWKGVDIESKVLMEASTNYAKHPSFPDSSKNLHYFANNNEVDMKFIYVMRNPIERIESQYTYSYARWISESLEERIQHGHLINVSRFAHQLDIYYSLFNPEDILLLDFEDLKVNPAELLKQICSFLKLDPEFRFSGLGQVHNKSQGTVITRPVDKLYKKHPFMKSISNILPKWFKRGISRCLFRTKIPENFKLTEDQRKRVHDALKDDMLRLNTKYGIDVSKWGF